MIPIFPTSYFGNIYYFKTLFQYKEICIESKENFIKQSLRNRCEILTANGVQQLSIPVIRKNGSKTPIDEVEIATNLDWQKNHWKAIESAYSSSPYFDHYGIEVKELIYNKEVNLLKFNDLIFNRVFLWLGIETKINYSTEYQNIEGMIDYRSNFPEIPLPDYIQVFGNSFEPNLSILDAIFCLGPMSRKVIE